MDTIPRGPEPVETPEVAPVVPVKRGRGRPKGSLGKKKREAVESPKAVEMSKIEDIREE